MSHSIDPTCSSILILLCDPTQVPFLTVGGNLGWREEVSRGVSELSGEYCVENVKGEDGELYRRLIFLSNANIIQSECHLISSNAGQCFFFPLLKNLVFWFLVLNWNLWGTVTGWCLLVQDITFHLYLPSFL